MKPDVAELDPYSDAGYQLIPLHRFDKKDGQGRERGKSPRDSDWTMREYKLADVLAWARRGGNVGVRLNEQHLVIDFDPRNAGDDPQATLDGFALEFGVDLESCPTVFTGSGGKHFYMRMPKGTRVRNQLPEFPGVEFKSRGRQVVSAGSIHPNTRLYEWDFGSPPLTDVPEAPEELLTGISKPMPATTASAPARLSHAHTLHLLRQLPVEDFAEHDAWFEIMQAVHCASGGDPEVAASFIKWSTSDPNYADHGEKIQYRWDSLDPNPKGPSVGPGTLFKRVIEHGGSPNQPAHEIFDEAEPVGKPLVRVKLDRTQQGQPRKSVANAVAAIDGLGLKPEYDDLRDRIALRGDLGPLREMFPRSEELWSDQLLHAVRWLMIERFGLELTLNMVQESVVTVALRQRFNPLIEWLDGLEWDGESRLSSWLTDYCGVTPSSYSGEVGKILLLGAVARAFAPGIKFDTMVVLEGPQGSYKSTLLRVLGGEFTLEGLPHKNPNDRDVIDAMRGYWIVEMEELANLGKTDVDSLKAFLSRTVDRTRLAYAKNSDDYKRRCVFVGTTNESSYLRDLTGNRRFLPVRIKSIDIPRVERDRLQLWAEAVAVWHKNPTAKALELPENLWSTARAVQEDRRIADPWEQSIASFIDKQAAEGNHQFSTQDLLRDGCHEVLAKCTQTHFKRLSQVMSLLGWRSTKIREGDRTVCGYRKIS